MLSWTSLGDFGWSYIAGSKKFVLFLFHVCNLPGIPVTAYDHENIFAAFDYDLDS